MRNYKQWPRKKWVVLHSPLYSLNFHDLTIEGPFYSEDDANSYSEYYSSKKFAVKICHLEAPIFD